MKSFIFIIPLTPNCYLNETREALQSICLNVLLKQSYTNWTALLVGKNAKYKNDDSRFIYIEEDGQKFEKLKIASDYIVQNSLKGDFIIRLDDDDVFNPNILSEIVNIDFDMYVDLYQSFWHYETGKTSKKVWNWFANTCIHKREIALLELERKDGSKVHLIETDHSKLHKYYIGKKVIFANKSNPIYLRSISDTSITANNSKSHFKYLKSFGNWKTNRYKSFSFLKKLSQNKNTKLPTFTIKETLINILIGKNSKREMVQMFK